MYLVTGGLDVVDTELSSTEQLTEGHQSWEVMTALQLPLQLSSLRAVEVNKIVYLTGESTDMNQLRISDDDDFGAR